MNQKEKSTSGKRFISKIIAKKNSLKKCKNKDYPIDLDDMYVIKVDDLYGFCYDENTKTDGKVFIWEVSEIKRKVYEITDATVIMQDNIIYTTFSNIDDVVSALSNCKVVSSEL